MFQVNNSGFTVLICKKSKYPKYILSGNLVGPYNQDNTFKKKVGTRKLIRTSIKGDSYFCTVMPMSYFATFPYYVLESLPYTNLEQSFTSVGFRSLAKFDSKECGLYPNSHLIPLFIHRFLVRGIWLVENSIKHQLAHVIIRCFTSFSLHAKHHAMSDIQRKQRQNEGF